MEAQALDFGENCRHGATWRTSLCDSCTSSLLKFRDVHVRHKSQFHLKENDQTGPHEFTSRGFAAATLLNEAHRGTFAYCVFGSAGRHT